MRLTLDSEVLFANGLVAGYYLYHRTNIPQLQTVFGQLWKEYALSDSRYLTSDVFTVCIEVITAVSRLCPSSAPLFCFGPPLSI